MSSSEPRIPLAEPTIGGNARRYLDECLSTNFVSSVGPFVDRFEEAFAAFVGARYAVACASGTAAIHLALLVLDIGAGDEVIVPSLTFVASANPVRYVGRDARLRRLGGGDLQPRSGARRGGARPAGAGRDPAARGDRGRPPAGPSGRPRAGDRRRRAPRRAGHRGRVRGARRDLSRRAATPAARSATIGRIGCFSFNGNKLITTGGGGMLVTDDEALARRARHLSTQARLPGLAYDHDEVGYNYRLSNLSRRARPRPAGADRRAPRGPARERRVLRRGDRGVCRASCRPPARPWADPSFWLYTTALASAGAGPARDDVLASLDRAGIDARPIWTTAPPDAAVARRRAHRRGLRGRHLRAGVLPALDVEPRRRRARPRRGGARGRPRVVRTAPGRVAAPRAILTP